jgi:hypothetical protein
MKNKFTEEYYKSNNYVDYLSKKERYVKTAEEIYQTFGKFKIIDQSSSILDYGCSLGFLIKGFEKIGFKNIYGYDISEWAISKAKELDCKIIERVEGTFDLGIFLDVLEHMTDDQIKVVFESIYFDKILVRIPCSIDDIPDKFFLEVSRKDETHINCKPPAQWIKIFNEIGFRNYHRLNMSTIYDSDGCFCALFIR